MRVAVVGAGFAGLAAADVLAARGADVTVFEARDRVGGRVHSRTLEHGETVELGAEFVLPGHDVVRATAARLGLEKRIEGAPICIVAADDTVMTRSSAELMAEVFPTVPLRREVNGRETLLAIDRARELLGYAPAHHWADHVSS